MPDRLLGRAAANLWGGVSQQPRTTRFLNAASESINSNPTVAAGLDKRPPSRFIAVGYASAADASIQSYTHFINRDNAEKYAITIYRDGSVGSPRWNAVAINLLTGATVPIYKDNTGGVLSTEIDAYLRPVSAPEQIVEARDDARMLTVGDNTFLLNRKRIAKMKSTTSAAESKEALLVVRAGAYGTRYGVSLDGDEYLVNYQDIMGSSYQDGLTPDGSDSSHSRYIRPDEIVRRILLDMGDADVIISQVDYQRWRVSIRNANAGTFKLSYRSFDPATSTWTLRTSANITYSSTQATMLSRILAELEAIFDAGTDKWTGSTSGMTYVQGVREDYEVYATGLPTPPYGFAELELNTNALTPANAKWSYTRASNVAVIFLQSGTANDFDIEPADSNPDTLLQIVRGEVDSIASLPVVAPDGFRVKVSGSNEDGSDDFYVEHQSDGGLFTHGVWKETVGYGVKTTLDEATMPHVFRSYISDGSGGLPAAGLPYFVFEPFDWRTRQAGDDDTNAVPSFIDSAIDGIAFHRGRLVFLSGENVVASEAGDPRNLFRISVSALLDTDRIDLSAQIADASDFQSAVEWNENLVLFTEQSQVVLNAGEGNLSPSTAGLAVAGAASVDPLGSPVTTGSYIFAPFRRGSVNGGTWSGYSGVYLMFDRRGGSAMRLEMADVTEQCPYYIEGRIIQMAASTTENMLAVLTSDRDYIYLYRWYEADGARVQSAWQKIKISSSYNTTGPRIVSLAFIESTLYVATDRSSEGIGLVYEKLDFSLGVTDDDFWSQIMLDHRVKSDASIISSIVFGGGNTTVTFAAGTWKRRGDGVSTGVVYAVLADIAGQAGGTVYTSDLPAGGGGGTSVVVFPGVDLTGKTFYIGLRYDMRHTLSPPYLEGAADGGTSMALVAGITHVRRAKVDVSRFADIAYELLDTRLAGSTGTRRMSHGTTGVDVPQLAQTHSVPIVSNSPDYALTIVNDSPYGGRINGVEYEIQYHSRSDRAQ